MSKLEQITALLENNSQIKIVGINEIDRRNDSYLLMHTDLAHVVNFNVIPKKGFEIDDSLAQKMQSFMSCIIKDLPNLKPNYIDNFEQEIITFKEKGEEKRALFLKMGGFYFDENLYKGIIKTTLHIDNKMHEMSEKVDYITRTIISPFPNDKVADKHRYTNYIGCINVKSIIKLNI